MEIIFEQKKKQMQEFYNKWVKPVKEIMSPELQINMEEAIKKYSLIR